MIRVIVLDVDGVLNSETFLRSLEDQHRQLGHVDPPSPKRETTCTCFKLDRQIDRGAITRLNTLVEKTGAKIVMSSSWRTLFDLPELRRILASHGLVAEIIDATPDGANDRTLLAMHGYSDQISRGHEIDYWLKQHPEVEGFVILDDGSDMEPHKNRLVQTDPEEGLLDEHVDLAIRVIAWDGTSPSAMEALALTSTRSNASEDAHRDFDGFDVTEELIRFREAFRQEQWAIAAELAANLDEHLSRGGSLPVPWLGPACMQEDQDRSTRVDTALEAAATIAAAMTPQQAPSSSWGLHCHEDGCVERLELQRTMREASSDEFVREVDDYAHLAPALDLAAVSLGWRIYQGWWWCLPHTVTKQLACARCLSSCPDCSCMGGPRSEAVDGLIIDVQEIP